MLKNNYTRLSASQQQLVSILIGLFIVLLLNSAYLIVFDKSTTTIYIAAVVLHAMLGLAVLLPLLLFLYPHIKKMWRLNKRARLAGFFLAAIALALIATGVGLVAFGANYAGSWILWLHIGLTLATIAVFFLHVWFKKGVHFHFLQWAELYKSSRVEFLRHPLTLTILFGLLVLTASGTGNFFRSVLPFVDGLKIDIFTPGQAGLEHDQFLSDTDLGRSESCGQAGCHPDIFQQWSESAHRFSSFNNIYYRKTVEFLVAREGIAPARFCASCHDPLVLFTGRMQDSLKIDMQHPTSQAGITCLSCHAIKGMRDRRGNGRQVIGKPEEYPFARSNSAAGKWLHNTLIAAKPEPHRRAMLKDFYKEADYCGMCHKVGLPPEINGYRWKRGQNQYDSWHDSGVSGNIVRSFYLPEKGRKCQDCHMPPVQSEDQGNDDGFVKDHRFLAANSALPYLHKKKDQLAGIKKKLSTDIVTLDIFQVAVNGRVFGPGDKIPVIKSGDRVKVTVVVRSRGVGHRFPAGTNDSNEIWINLQARDQSGEIVQQSGAIDAHGFVDSTAHFFGTKQVDRNSQLIDKRNAQDWVATVYTNTINPGTAHAVHYQFVVDEGVEVHQIAASLNYRKFNQTYNRWVFRDDPGNLPALPVITMAQAMRRAGERYETDYPLRERWNDFAIGMLLQGATREAIEAFGRVSQIAPASPEGLINQARAFLVEGRIDAAIAALDKAEKRRPGYLKTAYFRGLTHKAFGEYDAAIAEWMKVVARYPQDRQVLRDIGRLHYLSERYREALNWFDRILAIDPEDLGGLYNRMLTLGALGNDAEFDKAGQLYRYHKLDERESAVAAVYKKKHPVVNNEAQPIHTHDLR